VSLDNWLLLIVGLAVVLVLFLIAALVGWRSRLLVLHKPEDDHCQECHTRWPCPTLNAIGVK
jgi:hypothetical protein